MRHPAARRLRAHARAVSALLPAVAFGALFFLLQEALRPFLVSAQAGANACRNVIYDVSQLANGIGASIACALFLLAVRKHGHRGGLRGLWEAYQYSWMGFLFPVAGIAWYVISQQPCAAAYSPGPVRHLLGLFAYVIGGSALLIESSLWAIPCAILLRAYAYFLDRPASRRAPGVPSE